MAPRESVLNGSVLQLLQFAVYEGHYPDFPKNLSSIRATPDGLPLPRRGDGYKAAFIIFAICSTLTVTARIWTRKWHQRVPLWWDDYAACLALVNLWALVTVQLLAYYIGGVGVHVYENTLQTLIVALQLEFAAQILYLTTAT